jgi:hypothetical protein
VHEPAQIHNLKTVIRARNHYLEGYVYEKTVEEYIEKTVEKYIEKTVEEYIEKVVKTPSSYACKMADSLKACETED